MSVELVRYFSSATVTTFRNMKGDGHLTCSRELRGNLY